MGEETAEIVVAGRGIDEDFVAFVEERARRFSLCGRVRLTPGEGLVITLVGPPALIDMMEVACMLGPVDAMVDSLDRRAASGPVPLGPFLRAEGEGR